MTIPEHLWRFPTREAIDSLASRFGFPNTPDMQDWEWEVANPARIKEFIAAYNDGTLSEDERFTLMETIIQSFAETCLTLETNADWQQTLSAIEQNISLHIYSVWYWSHLDTFDEEDPWNVTPFMRRLLDRYRSSFEQT